MGMARSRGFSLLELLIVITIIGVLMAITIPLMQSAMLRAHTGTMASSSRILHLAFKRYYIDFNMYPNSSNPNAFNLMTFDPLVDEGYYDAQIVVKLEGGQADAFDSPDDEGINQEFWLELTLDYDPSVRFLVADSNNAPLSAGAYMDGIYLYKNGVLKTLNQPVDR